MKKVTTVVLCAFVFIVLTAFTANKFRVFSNPVLSLEPKPIQLIELKQPELKPVMRVKDHQVWIFF